MFVLAVLCALIALSEVLVRVTPLRHLGSALLVIVLTSVVANLGVIPTYGGSELYEVVFSHVAPLGIFWLLLQVDLRRILSVGPSMLGLFLLGCAGTVAGVVSGMALVGGDSFGELSSAVGGMFVGTYTGGSANYIAVATEYRVAAREPVLYAGASVVDSAMTTLWMAATVILPRLLSRLRRGDGGATPAVGAAATGEAEDTEQLHPLDLALTLALGAFAWWGSLWFADESVRLVGFQAPATITLTTAALVLAQTPLARRLRGARVLGMFSVLLFLAVIGALCDLEALRELGELGLTLTLFVTVVVLVHGLFVFGGALLLKQDPAVAAVASQAGIGGGTSALALARSLGRADLVLPGILMGSLGTALGTYLGMATARWFL